MKKNSQIYDFAKKIFPYHRSITGEGLRRTLKDISKIIPILTTKKIQSGKKVFDWVIPLEWEIKQAYIVCPNGKKICNIKDNNLHVVSYSRPINKTLKLDELKKNLYSLPSQPNAIPYVTSYYDNNWGFCISENQKIKLKPGNYKAFIDSKIFKGNLNYGEILIKGKTTKEIFLSTYICHPSMANNEVSGPSITTFLAKSLMKNKNLHYSYRIVFIPETIGSIAYLSKNLNYMKKNIIGGFNISCVGDERTYSYLPSRNGNSLSDKIAIHTLKWLYPNYKSYSWKDRGSDERQYCAPGVDLPIASIMRSKYGEYPEYHTSLDNFENLVTSDGLNGSFDIYKTALDVFEKNIIPIATNKCEPMMSKRNLYPKVSKKFSNNNHKVLMNILTYSDGNKDLIDIADILNIPVWDLYESISILVSKKLIRIKKI
jgi:aminopeptidase-like protein